MKKTICLNMIVKNESSVIRRCLDSIKHLIDYWIIVDTGSTDGTQKIIKEHLKDIPGELHEHPWVNFGHNRNEALKLTKGKADYALFIDADDILVFSEEFCLPDLEDDAYLIVQKESYKSTFREHSTFFLIRTDLDYHWKGVLHEGLFTKTERKMVLLKGVYNKYINDGSRSKDPKKIEKDIKVLKKGIRDEPNNPRYRFYLARTYWSIKDYRSCLKYFQQRVSMKGDAQEVYYCLLFIPLCQQRLNFPHEIFINNYCLAHSYRPSRAEAMYELARYFVDAKNYILGYFCAKTALSVPMTSDHLFVESWVYDWGALLYACLTSFYLGYEEEANDMYQKLLAKTTIPPEIRESFKIDQWKEIFKSDNNLHHQDLMVS
jgi:glycosyltransferase involved in cell wall biosynthesis